MILSPVFQAVGLPYVQRGGKGKRRKRGRSGGLVTHGFGEVLIDQFLGHFVTAPATGSQTATVGKVGDMYCTIVHGVPDLGIGDRFAQAYVHE